MKKRMISFLMVFVMTVSMCTPVSAAEIGPEALELIPVSTAEVGYETLELVPIEDVDTSNTVTGTSNDISTEEAMPFEIDSTSQDDISADVSTYAIRNFASPTKVQIFPIVLRVETSEAFILNGISRSKTWTNAGQFDTLCLTSDQTQAFINQIANSLATNSSTSGYTWAIIGWYLEATILLTAERPKRAECAPYFPQSGTDYETETWTVKSQATELHLSQEFYLTKNVDAQACYLMSFFGNFYYTYTSGSHQGQEGGMGFSTGVYLNFPQAT